MIGTFVIGLIVGSMGQKMIDENLDPVAKNAGVKKDSLAKKPAGGR